MKSTREPFSACLITLNEEGNLEDALASVDFADEIIVVDSHSTDATRDIAARFRGRDRNGDTVVPQIIERDWPGHVQQKNFAIDAAQYDWVFCLDADERVTPELRREIESALSKSSPAVVGYTVPRRTFYLGRWIRYGGWYPDRKLRLFRRSCGEWGGVNPHDHVYVDGRVQDFRGDLQHYSYRNMAQHIRTINFFTDIAAKEKQHRKVRFPLLRMLVHPPAKFFKMYVLQRAFLEGTVGLLLSGLGAFYVFLKYAKLWRNQTHYWKEAEIASSTPRFEPQADWAGRPSDSGGGGAE